MKRSTWVVVGITAAVLVLAGQLPRLYGHAAARPAPVLATAAAPLAPARAASVPHVAPVLRPLAAPARPSLLVTASAPRTLAWRPLPLAWLAALAVAVVTVSLLVTLFAAARRDRRGRIFHMARRGSPVGRIARSTRLPQDAVRTLLSPGLGVRR